jgi:hypothetical protein
MTADRGDHASQWLSDHTDPSAVLEAFGLTDDGAVTDAKSHDAQVWGAGYDFGAALALSQCEALIVKHLDAALAWSDGVGEEGDQRQEAGAMIEGLRDLLTAFRAAQELSVTQ